jgi:hypothetical protein
VHVATIRPIQIRKTLLKGNNTRLPLWIAPPSLLARADEVIE